MQEIINEVVKMVVTASIAAIGPLVVAALIQVFRKLNLEVSANQQAAMEDTVRNVLMEVEEWASHRLKAQIPVTSGQKLTRAVETILDKLPGVTEEEAEQLVRQELPKIGLGAVHFLEQTVRAATNESK